MEPISASLVFVILCLLLMPCVPVMHANRRAIAMRRVVTCLVGVELLLALALGTLYITYQSPPLTTQLFQVLPEGGINFSIFYDGATGLMLLLVAFVGFVVSRFSIRYLDGEATQGKYFRWLSFTIGAVSLMVIAGNLLLFFAAWVMTSLGLHQLLLHYSHRAAAHRAAWTKFAISRLGDFFLITAFVLIHQTYGTFELASLFAQAKGVASASSNVETHAAIAWLLMLGAVTKSAQFPFHVWLPDTMETPTPVSALMHAGIVNAGGYLVIRMSPLLTLVPEVMLTLAVVGAFTACFAGVVMMTQPSVKRALAYSTVAQMGFMMLQCGLGIFAAAMLHIVAHSLYKAYAFLTSGSVIVQSQAVSGAASAERNSRFNYAALAVAAVATAISCFAVLPALGINFLAKPGGFALAIILCLAVTTWGWRMLSLQRRDVALIAAAGMTGLCLTYAGGYIAVAHILQPTVPAPQLATPAPWVFIAIAGAFCALFALHLLIRGRVRASLLWALRVHAVNGFYIDNLYHRVFASWQKS